MIKFESLEKCMYCGLSGTDVNLTDEHIVPFCLGGVDILPKSSCKKCQGIINGFETKAARFYGTVRLVENVQSRNPQKLPKTFSLLSNRGQIQISKQHMWGITTHIKLKPPTVISGAENAEKWVGSELKVTNYRAPNFHLLNKIYGINELQYVTPSPNFENISRLVAKIAHSYAIAIYGIDTFEIFLTKFILSDELDEIEKFVGSYEQEREPVNRNYEIYDELIKRDNHYLISVSVRLFAYTGGPDFQIIVGKVHESKKDILDARKAVLFG